MASQGVREAELSLTSLPLPRQIIEVELVVGSLTW